VTSNPATLTVTSQAVCLQTSGTAWSNSAFAPQNTQFIATYEATPNQANADIVIGFSLNAATAYASLAAITRFEPSGVIDARNGADYMADATVRYTAGATYRFRVVVDVSSKRYTVFVTPPGAAEVTLASNYAFRETQSTVSSLNNWGMLSDVGSVQVCNMTINGSTSSPITYLSPNPSSLSFGSVNTGSSSTLSSTLSNSSTAGVTVSNVSVAGAGFAVSGVSSGQTIAPGQTASLNVTFAPAATGSVTGSVTVTSSAANSPTTVTLSGSGTQMARSVTLSWSPSPSYVSGYNVYRSATSGGPYTRVNGALVQGTSYSDSNVVSGQRYYYVSSAVSSAGLESSFSNEASASIP
jgi:hypothetical protein